MTQNSIHSKFLIHWTGKSKKTPSEFVGRLKDTLKNGLYMKPGEETIHGKNGKLIKAGIARVCFTEIKLNQTQNHAKLYGSLGIGFNRDFVLAREGNPVFYVQNNNKGHIIENLDCIVTWMDSLPPEILKSNKKSIGIVAGYLKNMSDHNDSDLKYYNEMEWRIVHIERLTGDDNYIQNLGEKNKEGKNIYRVKVKPEDIQLIVFPNKKTIHLALNNNYISDFFKSHTPTLIALDDCINF